MSTPPTDWSSGERVFAPPSGTLDPDWLVPALLEAVPGTSPEDAAAALRTAWRLLRDGAPAPSDDADPLAGAATRIVRAGVRDFRA